MAGVCAGKLRPQLIPWPPVRWAPSPLSAPRRSASSTSSPPTRPLPPPCSSSTGGYCVPCPKTRSAVATRCPPTAAIPPASRRASIWSRTSIPFPDLRARFQMSPAMLPVGLDDVLETRGYEIEEPTLVLVADTPRGHRGDHARRGPRHDALRGYRMSSGWPSTRPAFGDDDAGRARLRGTPISSAISARRRYGRPSGRRDAGCGRPGRARAGMDWRVSRWTGRGGVARWCGAVIFYPPTRWRAGGTAETLLTCTIQVEATNHGACQLYVLRASRWCTGTTTARPLDRPFFHPLSSDGNTAPHEHRLHPAARRRRRCAAASGTSWTRRCARRRRRLRQRAPRRARPLRHRRARSSSCARRRTSGTCGCRTCRRSGAGMGLGTDRDGVRVGRSGAHAASGRSSSTARRPTKATCTRCCTTQRRAEGEVLEAAVPRACARSCFAMTEPEVAGSDPTRHPHHGRSATATTG